LKRALTIKETALGRNDPQLLPILDNYAVVLRALNRTSEADLMEARAKELRVESAVP
jgi:hypothetical protein